MNNPLILHVNCVEQGQSIEQMCRLAVRWGYKGIEFRRRRFGIEEDPEAYLDAIAKAVEKTGMDYVLFGAPGPNLTLDDAGAREREVDQCVAFFRMAAERFDLTVCNTQLGELRAPGVPREQFEKHGSATASEVIWTNSVEGFTVLGRLAAERGFRFAFETHMVYLHDLPRPTRELVDRINLPSVGINLDYANMAAMKDGPSLDEALEICADRIYLVHIKNFYRVPGRQYGNTVKCALADGEINNRLLLRRLHEMGYTGPIVIESPRPGDREWFAQEDLAYTRSIIEELNLHA